MTECCLSIAQPQDRARSGPLFQALNLGSITAAGFVLVCVDDSQKKSLTTAAVGHPRSRAVVSADCWLKPGLSYFLLPLSILEGPEMPAVPCNQHLTRKASDQHSNLRTVRPCIRFCNKFVLKTIGLTTDPKVKEGPVHYLSTVIDNDEG
eukprot:Skav217017  [mRNA]  locus=scaffold1803:262752:264143:- [translate_table: standard]